MKGYKGGLRWYWKQRPYQRPDGSVSGPRRRHNKAELGNGRRRFWRFSVSPRLRLIRRLACPKVIFSRICDAYVGLMFSLAGSRAFASVYGYGNGGEATAAFGRPKVKEYNEKLVVEIYKTIMTQNELFGGADGGGAVLKAAIGQ